MKIAPTLQVQITSLTGSTGEAARKELHALIAVAKAAKIVHPTPNPNEEPCDLCRALDRLEKVSAK